MNIIEELHLRLSFGVVHRALQECVSAAGESIGCELPEPELYESTKILCPILAGSRLMPAQLSLCFNTRRVTLNVNLYDDDVAAQEQMSHWCALISGKLSVGAVICHEYTPIYKDSVPFCEDPMETARHVLNMLAIAETVLKVVVPITENVASGSISAQRAITYLENTIDPAPVSDRIINQINEVEVD